MKNLKLMLTGFAMIAIVGTGLAFKTGVFGDGSVYCTSSCVTPINVRVDNVNGVAGNPCTTGTPHVLCGDGTCVATVAGTKFSPTAQGE